MKVIYISSACSPKLYADLIEKKGIRNQQQSQKYNFLLAEGLVNNGVNVEMISIRPVNRSTEKSIFFNADVELYNNILFRYIAFFNLPILRNISVFLFTFVKLLLMKYETGDVVLCDALNISAAAATVFASKVRKIKTCAIITDVPSHRATNESPKLYERINLYFMKKFKGYLLLTKEMNTIVNPKNRPFIVMEGHCDSRMRTIENILTNKYEKKVCLYAGITMKMYGIDILVDGFLEAGIDDAELHIYGSGDYADELVMISKKYPDRIKYFGVAPNAHIVQEELRAWLLINPRPTNEDFTKYSFPSKNMEYMASGTPILTTRLPGMPQEYEPYCFFIDNESVEGIRDALKNVFSNSQLYLHDCGSRAKNFVVEEKNNIVQGAKIKDFFEFGL